MKDNTIAVLQSKGIITSDNGQVCDVITTKGWDAQVKWTNQSISWMPLNVVKESNPLELAEFAYVLGYESEPAFKWWFKQILHQQDRIISCLKTVQYQKGQMKFGVQIVTIHVV